MTAAEPAGPPPTPSEVEALPLAERADAFQAAHDRLLEALGLGTA